jgi:protein SCO1
MATGPARVRTRVAAACLLLAALALLTLPPDLGWTHDPQDTVLEHVGVNERLGKQIPLDLGFRDQAGTNVRLADYFTGGPVLLTLNYYACPTLCPLVFRNLAQTVGRLGDFTLGKDFRIVTFSINPDESPDLAREKSAATYAMLGGLADPGNRWPFLRGDRNSIDRLATALGVHFTRAGEHDFAHPNVVVVVTPEGRVSRYLYGLEQQPRDLRLALLEATDGRIGTSRLVNQALLYCFHYDPVGRKYVLFASRLMTVAMVLVLVLTLGLLVRLWKREKGEPHV